MNDPQIPAAPASSVRNQSPRRGLSEDWAATLVGLSVLVLGLGGSLATRPADVERGAASPSATPVKWVSPVEGWVGKPGTWSDNPVDAFREKPKASLAEGQPAESRLKLWALAGAYGFTLFVCATAILLRGDSGGRFLVAFPALFCLPRWPTRWPARKSSSTTTWSTHYGRC